MHPAVQPDGVGLAFGKHQPVCEYAGDYHPICSSSGSLVDPESVVEFVDNRVNCEGSQIRLLLLQRHIRSELQTTMVHSRRERDAVRPETALLKRRGDLEDIAFSVTTTSRVNSSPRLSWARHRCAATPPAIRTARTDSLKRAAARMCETTQKCARCGKTFVKSENKAGSCLFHGDILGNVMQLTMYEDHHFDDPALDNVKGPRYGRRWACCQDTDEHAPPCKSGYHVTYDCSPAQWAERIEFAVK
ncbi:hypothetical protein FGB62_14g129 [Gracilaria domingensis]|nr:hypothetical protein FGB62_14g129 [Gracilaria domingensis]